MQDNVGALYIFNDTTQSTDKMKDINTLDKSVVYEVIRVIDKVPLFLEDHYERLKGSRKLLGHSLRMPLNDLSAKIKSVVDANDKQNCNVKLIVYDECGAENSMLYISKSYYPSKAEINAGVRTSLMHRERSNPNIKLANQDYKDAVNNKMKQENAFEVLLVNDEGKITEGSRSNAFFIKGQKVYTAPGECILKGITRQYILDACKDVGVEVIESLVGVDELDGIDGVFISGTSIKVLPIAEIDERRYESSTHPTVVAIRDRFDEIIEEYIASHNKQ